MLKRRAGNGFYSYKSTQSVKSRTMLRSAFAEKAQLLLPEYYRAVARAAAQSRRERWYCRSIESSLLQKIFGRLLREWQLLLLFSTRKNQPYLQSLRLLSC